MSVGTVIALLATPVLAAAMILTLVRMARGPTTLNRVVAADVLIAVLIAALALETVVHRHATTLPVILVLSLVGFAGSLSVARFVADRDQAQRWDPRDGRPSRWRRPSDPSGAPAEPGPSAEPGPERVVGEPPETGR